MIEEERNSSGSRPRWNLAETDAIFAQEVDQAMGEIDAADLEDPPAVRQRLLGDRAHIMKAVEPSLTRWRQTREAQKELGARGVVGVLIFVTAAIPLLLGIVSFIRQLWDSMPSVQILGMAPWTSSLTWLAIAVIQVILGGVLVVTSEPAPNEEAKKARSLFVSDVRQEIRAALLLIINDVLAESRTKELMLDTSEARDLVELNSADILESHFISRCIKFLRSHRASAIGISGPRGVGKTTIMQKVCNHDPANYLGVHLPAPVSYAPDDFVRLLHREVLRRALEDEQGEDGTSMLDSRLKVVRSRRTHLWRLFSFVVLVYVGIGIIAFGRSGFQPPRLSAYDVAGGALIGAGLVALSMTVPQWVSRRARSGNAVVELCNAELSRLDWTSKAQSTTKNSVKWKIFTFEDQDQIELTERAVSHADLATGFKSFATRYAELTGCELIIAIDELDKMSDSSDLLAAVNGMKDLFRGSGTHFLVSVSEDALASFALRGVPIRDAFDSSFDEVVSVTRFTVSDSRNLLARRVIGFPDILSLFCHALSGGLPRDLIRLARHCIAVRGGDDSAPAVTTSTAVKVVTRQHLSSILEGALHQALATARSADDPAQTKEGAAVPAKPADHAGRQRRAVLECRAILDEGSPDTHTDVRECLARLDAARGAEVNPALESIIAMISVLEAANAYFSLPRTRESWEAERVAGEPEQVAMRIARCVADVSVDPEFALTNLEWVRRATASSAQAADSSHRPAAGS